MANQYCIKYRWYIVDSIDSSSKVGYDDIHRESMKAYVRKEIEKDPVPIAWDDDKYEFNVTHALSKGIIKQSLDSEFYCVGPNFPKVVRTFPFYYSGRVHPNEKKDYMTGMLYLGAVIKFYKANKGYDFDRFFQECVLKWWPPSIENELNKLIAPAHKNQFESAIGTLFDTYGENWWRQYQNWVYVTMYYNTF